MSTTNLRRHATTVATAGCPLRKSMIHFVAALRSLDSWKKEEEAMAVQVADLEHFSSPCVKSPMAKSSDIKLLLEFMATSTVQINFLIQLPSIELCLAQWWPLVSQGESHVTPSMLSHLYLGLGTILMEGRTANLTQNAVKMLMRGRWCKWEKWDPDADPPLNQADVHRLVFDLGYLSVQSDKLHDFVSFFQSMQFKLNAFFVNFGASAKASLTERRSTRLQRLETKESRKSKTIVLHPMAQASDDDSAPPDDPTVAFMTGGVKSNIEAKLTPMTITLFPHIRTHEPSSQIVVKDLRLLLPEFQKKFRPMDAMAAEMPVANATPLRIRSIPWMNASNQLASARTSDKTAKALANPLKTLDDVERLVDECAKSLRSPADDDDQAMLRRSISHPVLRHRLHLSS
ncbi:hypothetical protein LEN26_007918 [Aphanomyces euteiches]|nr:hypothetical protein AeMF1_002703 [Aphanomyces euteiches]KAH9131114.1 hypothetical protein LEN26_007918 [Aphanomyces euteiches]KAH9195751.1 hypothetical protein AeNC1_002257 [Aphanomyces euteiches]